MVRRKRNDKGRVSEGEIEERWKPRRLGEQAGISREGKRANNAKNKGREQTRSKLGKEREKTGVSGGGTD